jgi:hypothetical protein
VAGVPAVPFLANSLSLCPVGDSARNHHGGAVQPCWNTRWFRGALVARKQRVFQRLSVQRRSTATGSHEAVSARTFTDRLPPAVCPASVTLRAATGSYGSEGRGFESLRARYTLHDLRKTRLRPAPSARAFRLSGVRRLGVRFHSEGRDLRVPRRLFARPEFRTSHRWRVHVRCCQETYRGLMSDAMLDDPGFPGAQREPRPRGGPPGSGALTGASPGVGSRLLRWSICPPRS